MNKNNNKNSNDPWKILSSNILIWLVIVIIAAMSFQMVGDMSDSKNLSQSEFIAYLNQNSIQNIEIKDGRDVSGTLSHNGVTRTFSIDFSQPIDNKTVEDWDSICGGCVKVVNSRVGLVDYLFQFSPWIIIMLFWFYIMRRMQGGGGQNGIFSFGKSRAKIINPDKPKTTFKDVAGCDEAKVELQEIVDFLKHPAKYKKIGAKIPRGGLLLGPPGTGKTLLAKAVSGEAGVPFFSISGAEFVEMFVGVGASRVRDLFGDAKKNAPSIIFIDEIDAVGRHRGAGLGGGHDEREQTLNQILVEMDGFDTDDSVILLAATNRPDVLDKALLRPGRFDRQIVVDVPSLKGREDILKIHSKKINMNEDVDLRVLARGTPGLAGADLENLVNEAALLSARKDRTDVSMEDFEDAKDKVMMGVERKSMILTDNERKITAYHEGGHALVAYFTKGADPVHKITIIPRGRALGLTAQIPADESHNYSRSYLLGRLDILMGGRSAEKLIFNDTSTGAGNDIAVATDIARKMVCEWGMSDEIGPLTFGKKDEEVFLGREISKSQDVSNEISKNIDDEIIKFVKNAENNADKVLSENINHLHDIAKGLLEYETISGDDMDYIIKNGSLDILDTSSSNKKSRSSRRASNTDSTPSE